MQRRWLALCLLAGTLLGVSRAMAAPPSTEQPQGLRDELPSWYALQGGQVVVRPGRVLDGAVIVIRDGAIVQVGGEAPAGAKAIDLTGRTVYPGLIDAYSEQDIPDNTARQGAPYWNVQVRPQVAVSDHFSAANSTQEAYRSQGVVARLVAPADGILRGSSAVVSTGSGDDNGRLVLRSDVAQHALLSIRRRSREEYPSSPMGAVALARQAFYDAQWHKQALAAHQADSTLPRPPRNDSLQALLPCLDQQQPLMIDAPNELYFLRADLFAREFALRIIVRGSGQEYKRLDAVRQAGRAVVVPVQFPQPPNVGTPESAMDVTLADLMHWDLAPENPARLVQAGVTIALTAHGLKDTGEFLSAVRTAVERGLDKDDALRALTTTPAELCGVDRLLGSIEPGKLASLVVTDGDLFEKDTKVVETWVEGRRFQLQRPPLFSLAGTWHLKLPAGTSPAELWITLSGEDKLKGQLTRQAPDQAEEESQVSLGHAALRGARFSCDFAADDLGRPGQARLSALLAADGQSWHGQLVWPDGSSVSVTATSADDEEEEKGRRGEEEKGDDEEKKDEEQEGEEQDVSASCEVNFPLGAFGRSEPPAAGAWLLKNATLWTCGPQGRLERASLLIQDGRIGALGADIEPPPQATVVDLQGRHVTPGIIDCHSHMATDGGVNEGTQAITAEVRIGDFIDSDDVNIYRQLAGGVTTSNILHGSANPIGGQNQVIKLRWGARPEEMKFAQAPAGIKFALGENVKQSNWGDDHTTRYPQTRMGVEQIMRDAFQAAQHYQKRRDQWRSTPRGLPPRRDLELDALAEVLAGQRWVHCHSYRQDEILALIRTLDDFQVQIGTFQHILEGYKVADAMAKHGAMGSAFSDWWAYKFEVFDAIPYNGALMHEAGIVVSFNSDDRELARRLNLEAAKAVKYGGVPPEEALKFVTLNPARQLRIEKWVGSLEPGKDADFVVWSGPPLSTYSRCEQTWIDGRKYFDRQDDLARRSQEAEVRNTLVQKILRSGKPMRPPGERDTDISDLWPREDLFCHGHSHGR